MAECCLDCMNKYVVPEKRQLTHKDVVLKEKLCDFCGEIKPCVITVKLRAYYRCFKGREWYQFWRK